MVKRQDASYSLTSSAQHWLLYQGKLQEIGRVLVFWNIPQNHQDTFKAWLYLDDKAPMKLKALKRKNVLSTIEVRIETV